MPLYQQKLKSPVDSLLAISATMVLRFCTIFNIFLHFVSNPKYLRNSFGEIHITVVPLHFKVPNGTMEMWSYIAGGLKIKVQWYTKPEFWDKNRRPYNQRGLKINGCETEGPL